MSEATVLQPKFSPEEKHEDRIKVITKEIWSIWQENGNTPITPQSIVDRARDPDNPLHDEFEWNDVIAGELYRRDQARKLIRLIEIPAPVSTDPVSVFLNVVVKSEEENVRGYVPIDYVVDSNVIAEQLLSQFSKSITYWLNKLKNYSDLFGMDIEKQLERLEKTVERMVKNIKK